MNNLFKDILLDYIAYINFFRTQSSSHGKKYSKPSKYSTMYGVIATVASTIAVSMVINLQISGKDIHFIPVIILAFILPYSIKGLAKSFALLSEILNPILNDYLSDDIKAEVGLTEIDEINSNSCIVVIFREEPVGSIRLHGYEEDIYPYLKHILKQKTGVNWVQATSPVDLLEFSNDAKDLLEIEVDFTDQTERLTLYKLPYIEGK